MADEVVELRISTFGAVVTAVFYLLFLALSLKFAIDPFETGRTSPEVQRVTGAICMIISVGGVVNSTWLAYTKPVGLRLDHNGLSGHYVWSPFSWPELAELGRSKSNRFGAVKLRVKDTAAPRFARTGWRRILYYDPSRWHVVIPAAMIGLTRNELVDLIRQWHKKYG